MAQQIKLTREELYRKIWEQPTVKVAAEFRISDVGLAKICRKMDVPKPPLGYWRRIETGAKPTCTRKITPSGWRESTKIKIGDSSYEKDIYRRADRRDSARF